MENNTKIGEHTSQRYNAELEALRERVLTMGGVVERQCQLALESLVKGNAELASQVAGGDYEVNDLEVKICDQCTDILARRQPAAGDLRMIVAIIRMVANLERIGDEASKIGRKARKLADAPDRHAYIAEPLHLGKEVSEMLRGALDAFARLDVQSAIEIIARDPEIDREFKSLNRLLISHIMEQPQRVKNMLRINSCARALERIGDHAVNLCEEVVYLVRGADVRHLSVEEIKQRYQPRA
ncbi:MAG: phosphate signaling complex protein PhoU [Halieaceae bacterium]|nr:phosphate signaling complex protein PhoU [Halieaceae bacterium]MCP5148969.1 phosphate signaling complex protein PhoU [Pseudomonadales bacterium]MCP5166668.1 phosphate signaling complex protein PhoU [Pseudomonadales bacterium]MCP5186623.1 phosphate signaling complex protein PhoU [Pseudomonadales bacterium]